MLSDNSIVWRGGGMVGGMKKKSKITPGFTIATLSRNLNKK